MLIMNTTSTFEKCKMQWKFFIVVYELGVLSVSLFAQVGPNIGYFREEPLKTKYQVKYGDAKEETNIASRTA